MSLLNFEKWFGQKKPDQAPQPIQQPTSEQNPQQPGIMVNLDQYREQKHQALQAEVGNALGASVEPGSTIPPLETSPGPPPNIVAGDPLSVIKGPTAENVLNLRQSEVNATMPEPYKNAETGWGNAADRFFLNKDGLTTPVDFIAEKKKREADLAAVHQEVKQIHQDANFSIQSEPQLSEPINIAEKKAAVEQNQTNVQPQIVGEQKLAA